MNNKRKMKKKKKRRLCPILRSPKERKGKGESESMKEKKYIK
jgi:hypothetical protein